MIAYFDTSAIVPLLVEESGSERANLLWNEADRVVAARLVYAEGCAAVAMAARLGRLDQAGLRIAKYELDQLYRQMDIVEISDEIVRRAGVLAEEHSLRGYDAVHLASAEAVSEDGFVLVNGDGSLLQAASALGLAVART
nr:type II toxin-antitoxin system VapC family toxin [Ferrimicrobium acidiphilum]